MPDYALQRYRGKLAIVWHEGGRRHRHSLGTTDRASAEAAARAFWQRRSVSGEFHTVGEAVTAYLNEKADMASIRNARLAWRVSAPFWDKMPIARVDDKTAERYGETRKNIRAISVRNELSVIRAALNWAQKKNYIVKAPFIQMPSLPESQVGHISKAQFRKLLDGAIAPHVRLFMELAAATGSRTNALLDLTWDRVDFERKLIKLNPVERVQTAKYRATVSMNDQILAILKKAKEGSLSDYVIEHGRGKVGSIKKGFAAASERSGVKCSPHMLRHSAAVWMAEARIPMAEIARFLGHSDSRITERVYAVFGPEHLADAAAALTW